MCGNLSPALSLPLQCHISNWRRPDSPACPVMGVTQWERIAGVRYTSGREHAVDSSGIFRLVRCAPLDADQLATARCPSVTVTGGAVKKQEIRHFRALGFPRVLVCVCEPGRSPLRFLLEQSVQHARTARGRLRAAATGRERNVVMSVRHDFFPLRYHGMSRQKTRCTCDRRDERGRGKQKK